MKKTILLMGIFALIVGQTTSATVTDEGECATGELEPYFILSSSENAHILNYSDSYYSDSDGNKVVCMDDNFSVQVDSSGLSLGDYTEAFSVTEYFTDPEYGSHVKIPPTEDGQSVYLDYSGIKTVDDVGAGICDTSSSNCKFLFSVNSTESEHGSHVGQRDSGENIQIELRTGFRVNIRSITQYEGNPYRIKMNVSADTGAESVGIFERTIDWNTSDDKDSITDEEFGRNQWPEFPKNVTEQLEGPATYPEAGEYDVNISLRYILDDGRYKYKNRTVNLPSGSVEWDRTLEIEDSDQWVVLGPIEEIDAERWNDCGGFLGYKGQGDGIDPMLRTDGTEPLPDEPMLGSFTRSCTIEYMHSTSPDTISFGQSTSEDNGGWNITRLQEPMNFSKFYEGDTDCGGVLGYGVKDGELQNYFVTSSTSEIVYEEKMAKRSLISTTNDCKVTTS